MIALTADLPCILAADPAASCVIAFAWAVLEVLTCLLIVASVVAFAWIHLDSSGLWKKINHWRGRDT